MSFPSGSVGKTVLKILLVHNFYDSAIPSGENRVFLAEATLLRKKGNAVIEFTRHSDEIRERGVIGTFQGAFSTPWNPFSERKILSVLHHERPDIMHVHNFFPSSFPCDILCCERSWNRHGDDVAQLSSFLCCRYSYAKWKTVHAVSGS
jgi:hypothetical protein